MDNFNNHYNENQDKNEQNSRPVEYNAYQPHNQNPYQNNYSQNYNVQPTPNQPKKDKRKFTLTNMIAVALCSALLCGVVSSVSVTKLNSLNQNNSTTSSQTTSPTENNGSTTTNKQITVTDNTQNIAEAVSEKSSGSVVGIRVTAKTDNGFFGSSTSQSEGSGVVYSQDGYIITNYHVISDAVSSTNYGQISNSSTITVYLPSDLEEGITATIVGYDSSMDIAIIKIDKTGLTPIEIGNSSELKVGEKVFAIGNPGGLEFMGSISQGIVSGLNRSITTETSTQMHLIQTDAAINPGNSGGALVDSEGKLIGINNSKMAGENFEGMGFAIPVDEVIERTESIIKKQGQPQPYIGVTINTNYTSSTLERMGYPAGIVVYSVADNSPAQTAGLQQNDIITAINGTAITSYSAMISEKNKYEIGQEISITIYRQGKTGDVKITLGHS